MENGGEKLEIWGFKRVVIWELDIHPELPSGVRTVCRSSQSGNPTKAL
jgi:hypothetical protein